MASSIPRRFAKSGPSISPVIAIGTTCCGTFSCFRRGGRGGCDFLLDDEVHADVATDATGQSLQRQPSAQHRVPAPRILDVELHGRDVVTEDLEGQPAV